MKYKQNKYNKKESMTNSQTNENTTSNKIIEKTFPRKSRMALKACHVQFVCAIKVPRRQHWLMAKTDKFIYQFPFSFLLFINVPHNCTQLCTLSNHSHKNLIHGNSWMSFVMFIVLETMIIELEYESIRNSSFGLKRCEGDIEASKTTELTSCHPMLNFFKSQFWSIFNKLLFIFAINILLFCFCLRIASNFLPNIHSNSIEDCNQNGMSFCCPILIKFPNKSVATP